MADACLVICAAVGCAVLLWGGVLLLDEALGRLQGIVRGLRAAVLYYWHREQFEAWLAEQGKPGWLDGGK